MSMTFNLRLVSDPERKGLLGHPDQIEDFVTGALEDEYPTRATLGIDKAWHLIHLLLTGTAWEGKPPLDFILGGPDVGDVDLGYGPARAFTKGEVTKIAEALAPITADALRSRLPDCATLESLEIYPHGWGSALSKAQIKYFMDRFEELKAFLFRAAKQGMALVVFFA